MTAHQTHRKTAIAYRVNTWPRRYWRAFMRITSYEPYPVDIIGGVKQVVGRMNEINIAKYSHRMPRLR
jgi:hypothetical protein